MDNIYTSKKLFELLINKNKCLDENDIMNIRDFFVLETLNAIQSRNPDFIYSYSELLNSFYNRMRSPDLMMDSFNSLFEGYHGCLKLNAFFFYLLSSILTLHLDMTDDWAVICFQDSLSETLNKS